jgi:DNA (cytosine-5)-methyltransferase 1
MVHRTLATLFSGGGLFDVGAQAAGLTPIWAVERDPDIATVYRKNHPDGTCIVRDVGEVDYTLLPVSDWLHASPSCVNASIARATGGGETEEDRQAAKAIVRALERLPRVFSLENVWRYRLFDAFQMVTQQLDCLGYAWDFWHLNAADYGVPQTRKRLILVARRDGTKPRRPGPTHCKGGSLFDLPWRSWYEAIEDLLPTLPADELAPWQLRRLQEHPHTSFLVSSTPSLDGKGFRSEEEPAYTVMASPFSPIRATLVAGQNGSPDRGPISRLDDAPAFTLTTSHPPRAVLVEGSNGGQRSTYHYVPRAASEPAPTVTASAASKTATRALVAGRCVQLSPRALARLQSIPDGYVLPERRRLAGQIIGNGVPPLLAQRVVEANSDGG